MATPVSLPLSLPSIAPAHDLFVHQVPKYKEKKRQVWVLAKHHRFVSRTRRSSSLLVDAHSFPSRRYFTSDRFPYSKDIFEKASKELDIEFVGAVSLPSPSFPLVLRNLTRLPPRSSQWNDDAEDNHQPVLGVTRLGGRAQLNETEFDAQLIGSLASVGLRFVSAPLFSFPCPRSSL